MPYCFVPDCQSCDRDMKRLREEGKPFPRFFHAPNKDALKVWKAKIRRADRELTLKDQVCSKHFKPECYETTFKTLLKDGTIHEIPREKALLRKGAVPTIFEGRPSYQQKVTKSRKPPAIRHNLCSRENWKKFGPEPKPVLSENLQDDVTPKLPVMEGPPEPTTTAAEDHALHPLPPGKVLRSPQYDSSLPWCISHVNFLPLPSEWVICSTADSNEKAIVHINAQLQVDKSMCFKPSGTLEIKINGIIYKLVHDPIKTMGDAKNLVIYIDKLNVCGGTDFKEKTFSERCLGAYNSVSPKCTRCCACQIERQKLKRKEQTQEKVQISRAARTRKNKETIASLRRSKEKLLQRVNNLKAKLSEARMECNLNKSRSNAYVDSPEPQQEQQEEIGSCIQSATVLDQSGGLFTIEWAA